MEEEEATQRLTQIIGDDPRTRCNQSIEINDESLADILCILHPTSNAALRAVAQINEHSIAESELVDANTQPNTTDLGVKVLKADNASSRNIKPRDIVLRLSSLPKDPTQGFCFGRQDHNDFMLIDPEKRISKTHFKIYVNEYGTIMIQDSSTNGTYVDSILLQGAEKENDKPYRHTLEHGSVIKIIMASNEYDNVLFIVRIPRREGDIEENYENNLENYFTRLNAIKLQRAKEANPSPPVLFPFAFSEPTVTPLHQSTNSNIGKRARNWKGGDKYNVVNKIGQGAFATVYKITQKNDGRVFAAKELDKRKFVKNGQIDIQFGNEMKIMMRIHHENIVKFVEHIDWEDHFYIIMEMIPGGDLSQMIHNKGILPEDEARDMTTQLLSALGYLHSRNITHRDIKPENIMLFNHDPIQVKLTDFGLSKMVDNDTLLLTFCGTLLYCAPEVYTEFDEYDPDGSYHPERRNKKSKRDPYSKACDLWSLAGVLFFSLCQATPFSVEGIANYRDLLHTIMTCALDLRPLQKLGISDNCVQFLKGMLQRWPEQRPSVEKLQAHSWITGAPASQASTEGEDAVDMISDPDATELAESASSLSMLDRHNNDGSRDLGSLDEIDHNNLRLSLQRSFEMPSSVNSGRSSASESFGFMKNGPDRGRLFGELNSSALGSSGVIPDRRLNLPMSTFGSDQSQNDAGASAVSQSNVHPLLRNTPLEHHLYQNSTSLLGTESVFGQLQVRSPSAAPSPQSEMPPSPETQSLEDNARATRPTTSTPTAPSTSVRRQRDVYDDAPDEPVAKRHNGLSGSIPIDRTYFWTNDKRTWHDDYPKMTLAEVRELEAKAAAEGRKYIPPRTTANPNYCHTGYSGQCDSPFPLIDDEPSGKKELSAPSQADSHRVPTRILAKFVGEPGTILPSIAIDITEQFTSWGRGTFNTIEYQDGHDIRVPKYAFKLVLWNANLDSDNLLEAPDSIFYIATKSRGIWVNGVPLRSHDKENVRSESKHWAQLQHGDRVTIHDFDGTLAKRIEIRFECYYGVSNQPRSPNTPVSLVHQEQKRIELENIVYNKEHELFDKDTPKAGLAESSAGQQQPKSAASGSQPVPASFTSMPPPPPVVRSSRQIAKPRSGGPLARIRGESRASTIPSPSLHSSRGEGSNMGSSPTAGRST